MEKRLHFEEFWEVSVVVVKELALVIPQNNSNLALVISHNNSLALGIPHNSLVVLVILPNNKIQDIHLPTLV